MIFGKKAHDISHAFVAYRPRLEGMPTDADVMSYERSVASLTDDGVFHVEPWSTRNAGPVRRPVSQVNVSLFAYVALGSTEDHQSSSGDAHHDHHCFCCRECDSEGEDLNLQNDDQVGVDTEVLYGEDVDWATCPIRP